ncbi:MAG: ATP-binding protein [Microbacteriaceae bacterium]
MSAIVLIDGRSGSGKTELARAIVADNPGTQLVRLDDLYPGWNGLAAGSNVVHSTLLTTHRWQRWDWLENNCAEWNEIDPTRSLIIEGCGALSAANRARATLGVWVELDSATRKRRALDRDGDLYAGHWDSWAEQEDEFMAKENPRDLADFEVAGDAPIDLAYWQIVLATARVGL